MRKHRRRAAIASILVIISLVCGLFLQAPVLKAKGDEDDEDEYYLVNCTEKEAYEKGYDYYRAWYICNKGNYCQLYYGYQPPYHSVVTKNRRDQSYQYEVWQWRVLTFNLSELTAHSVKENAYCEALLFNLLYDEDSASMFDTATNDATGAIGEINKTVKNTGISAWKKLGKGIYKGDVWDAYSKIEGKSVAEIEELVKEANKTSELNDIIGDFSDAAKIIDTCATAGDYITGLTKVAQLVGKSNDMSHILADMSADTTNTAYSAALDNFSAYLSESITKDEANQIFTGAMGTREALDKAVDAIWGAVCKKNVAAAGIAVGSSVGKFLSNTLTGNDDQYNKFNELEVYYDIERLLHNEVDNLIYKIDDGDEVAARRFLVAYGMLKNMYNISLDCYESYADKMYKAGFLNMAFPGINGNKYENAMTICENLRTAVNNLFYADMAEADKAYQAAERKFDDTDSGVVVNNTVPTTIEEDRETCKEHRDTFTYVINKNTVVDRDKEIYGSVMLDSGALDLNGHKLTVYGSAFLTGKLTVNGVLDVKGDVYQYDSSMELTGASTVMVGGNYYQRGGSLSVRGGSLTVGGDHEIGYLDAGGNPIYDEHTMFYVDEDGQIKIGGSFIVHKLYSSSCEKGTMEVGKSVQVGAEDGTYLYGKSGFTLTLSGTSDVRIENVSGINLVIKNAAERNITMAGLVGASGLSGGAMTIHPEKLRFSAAMENDVVIDGDAEICGNVFLKTHSLTINGSLTHTGGGIGDPYYDKDSASVSDTGTLNVKGNVTQRDGSLHLSEGGNAVIAGNYYQRGGSVSVAGGSLTVGGDHEIGYLDANGNPLYDDHTMFSVTEDGQVKIGGGFTAHKLYSSYCEKGTMEVGKSVQAGAKDNSILDGKSGFTLTLRGTSDVRIENVNGMNLVIENAAERSITMAGLVGASKLSGGAMTVHPEKLRFYAALEDDMVIDGDAEICGNVFLKTHSLTINGSLTHTGGGIGDSYYDKDSASVSDTGTLSVKGNVTQRDGSLHLSEGGNALIAGNYYQRGGSVSVSGGSLTAYGDHEIGYLDADGNPLYDDHTMFSVTEDGQVKIGGGFTAHKLYSSYCEKGTMEVGKGVQAGAKDDSSLDGKSGFTLTLCGTADARIENVNGMKIVIENAAERTITMAGLIGPSSLGGGDLTVSPENLRFYGGLENDVVIDGDVEICGNLSLNGHSLTVKGNMLHTYGSLELEKGTLQIGGDYTAAVKTSDGYGQTDYAGLSMANPEDQIIVGGDMLVYTERGSQMTDGVLEVKGDFTQKGENSYAFAPSQNHVTRLSGTTLQRITFEADTKFNRLELGQYEENYVFTPEECWVTKTVYCPHTDKEVRGRVEATCMEDGYSGDTYCASCGILLEQGSKVRAEGHKIVEDPSVEPTCTEAGKTAGRHCSVCGQVLKEQTEIPAKGHVWDQGTVTKVPTAGEKGVKTYTCTVCGQTRIEELDAEGGQGSTEQTGNPGGQGSTEQTGNPGGQGSTEANPASQDATEKPENPTEQRTTEKSSEPSTQAATQAQTTQGGQASTEKPAKDHATKLNLANKKTYKFSKKVTIKDADGLKTVKVNGKTLKVKNGKKSCSFKLSTFKKYLRKGKWNKLVVTDLAGRKKTIKFKVR